jgi:Spy/CpxP family protein refolding chaperone
MQRSKQTALTFLLGALLVGGVLGFSADRVMLRDKICPTGRDQKGLRARMFDELDLTADQRAAMDSILDDRHRQMRALMAPIRPRLDSISEASWAQMTTIMTDQQRAEFERMRQEVRAERAAEHKGEKR